MATINVSDSSQTFENVSFSEYDSHYNFAYSTVATAPNPASTGTQLTINAGDGAKLSPGTYNATVWPTGTNPLTSNAEIVRVTGKSGDILQIQRTQENTTARSILIGDQIASSITAKTVTDIEVPGANAARAYIATLETTTSTSYADLTTPGPSVTVTIGANGLALMIFGAEMFNGTSGGYIDMSVVVSGANTIAVGTNPYRLFAQATGNSTPDNKYFYSTLLTGLTAGSTTFKCQYKVIVGGTGSFQYREISVISF